MFRKILLSLGILIGVLSIGAVAVKACTSNGIWGNWVNGTCVQTKCGSSDGLMSRTKTCLYHEGSNQCKPELWECPSKDSDYKSNDNTKDCKRKIDNH
jgi:hypothetical protein